MDLDVGPPRGQLAAGGAPPREFSGWLQLAEAVEAALAAARAGPAGPVDVGERAAIPMTVTAEASGSAPSAPRSPTEGETACGD